LSIDFGAEALGGTSASQTVTLKNNSQIPLIFNPSPAGTPPSPPAGVVVNGPFTVVTDNCSGVTVSAQGQCTVVLAFMPTAQGPATGSVVFSDNAQSSVLNPQAVRLRGQGVLGTPTPSSVPGQQPSPPRLSPSRITFSSQPVGGASAPQTVTVTNTSGTFALTISAVTVIGPFSASADTCSGATVLPLQQCTIGIAFTPTNLGTQSGTLTLTDNAQSSPANPATVQLFGTGVAARPS
jgi:hypothetical protein